jgi:hypothetical protein
LVAITYVDYYLLLLVGAISRAGFSPATRDDPESIEAVDPNPHGSMPSKGYIPNDWTSRPGPSIGRTTQKHEVLSSRQTVSSLSGFFWMHSSTLGRVGVQPHTHLETAAS